MTKGQRFNKERLTYLYPAVGDLAALREVCWHNDKSSGESNEEIENIFDKSIFSLQAVTDADDRLHRFAPLISKAFPETEAAGGIIESGLKEIPTYKKVIQRAYQGEIPGRLFVKLDSHLPISGSIKARGGIYEVLVHAERLALDSEKFCQTDDYTLLLKEPFRSLFQKHHLVAASTGNLGLSIGIIGAKLGFRTSIHMSADAKTWKKDLLKELGVEVIEHKGDFSAAVDAGRKSVDSGGHFVDDENSRALFFGYAVAALRLKKQLLHARITVDKDHPLFVYLPCGVGGGPGGVTFGLKLLYGDDVHCFFAEPTHAPAMTLGLITGLHDLISVSDIGLDNKTAADGLAVGRPSGFVGKLVEKLVAGCYTVEDRRLFERLRLLADSENIFLEPSALAGFYGPEVLSGTTNAVRHGKPISKTILQQATHIVWATGGKMVPEQIMKQYYEGPFQ